MKNKILNFLKNTSMAEITDLSSFQDNCILIHNILGGYIIGVYLNGKVEYTNNVYKIPKSFKIKDDFIRRRIFSLYYTKNGVNEIYKKEWKLFLRQLKLKYLLIKN